MRKAEDGGDGHTHVVAEVASRGASGHYLRI